MKATIVTAAILAAAVAGCAGHDCYVVEIQPDGDGFQRKLTCWHDDGADPPNLSPLPQAELERLERLYTKRTTPADAKKHVFVGKFTGETPNDVGGAGSYTRFPSPLGSLSTYVERFRGDDDLEGQLAKRREGVDRLADHVIGWLESQLGDDFKRLRNFLDEDFRRDLQNVSLYLHRFGNGAASPQDEPSDGESLMRIAQYLFERGYFAPKDVPALTRALDAEDPTQLGAMIQRFLARKMGVPDDQPVPESLAFLADRDQLEESWSKHVPAELLDDLLAEAFFEFELFSSSDSLEVRLSCPEQPLLTNGRWDAKTKTVSWSADLDDEPSVPAVFYAVCSTPNAEAQRKHFGRVLLAEDDLAMYATWYNGLTAEERGQWDRFLDGLTPQEELKVRLETFRFSTDPKPDPDKPKDKPPSLAEEASWLILQAMEAKDEEPTTPQ